MGKICFICRVFICSGKTCDICNKSACINHISYCNNCKKNICNTCGIRCKCNICGETQCNLCAGVNKKDIIYKTSEIEGCNKCGGNLGNFNDFYDNNNFDEIIKMTFKEDWLYIWPDVSTRALSPAHDIHKKLVQSFNYATQKIKQLNAEILDLKYKPGGPGYNEAKENFYKNAYSNNK